MRPRMQHGSVSWEESERIEDEWKKSFFAPDTMRAIGNFIVKHRGRLPDEVCCPRAGSFNITFGMKFKDGGPAILRFLNPSIMFLEEKVRNEVATMRYIQDHTAIPVPLVISSGTRGGSSLGSGPFIAMEYIHREMDMGNALDKPELSAVDHQCLNPSIDLPRLPGCTFQPSFD